MAAAVLHVSYQSMPRAGLAAREASPPAARSPRLLDRVRQAIRARHYSRRTEKAYVAWTRRYILFHGKRHPSEMGAAEMTQYLSSLAIQDHVSASTQNQALSALLFFYRDVLGQDLPWLDDIVRAKRTARLPVVLARDEVRAVIRQLRGTHRLMAILLYGPGLRLLECARLRVKEVAIPMACDETKRPTGLWNPKAPNHYAPTEHGRDKRGLRTPPSPCASR